MARHGQAGVDNKLVAAWRAGDADTCLEKRGNISGIGVGVSFTAYALLARREKAGAGAIVFVLWQSVIGVLRSRRQTFS